MEMPLWLTGVHCAFMPLEETPSASARLISFFLPFRLSLYPCILPSFFSLSIYTHYRPLCRTLLSSSLSISQCPPPGCPLLTLLTGFLAPYGMLIYFYFFKCMWLHVRDSVTKIRAKLIIVIPSAYGQASLDSTFNMRCVYWIDFVFLSLCVSLHHSVPSPRTNGCSPTCRRSISLSKPSFLPLSSVSLPNSLPSAEEQAKSTCMPQN